MKRKTRNLASIKVQEIFYATNFIQFPVYYVHKYLITSVTCRGRIFWFPIQKA